MTPRRPEAFADLVHEAALLGGGARGEVTLSAAVADLLDQAGGLESLQVADRLVARNSMIQPSRRSGSWLTSSGSWRESSMSPTSSLPLEDLVHVVKITRRFSARPSTGSTAMISGVQRRGVRIVTDADSTECRPVT
jgi:hypothetical protein